MSDDATTAAQTRMIAETVARAVLVEFEHDHPQVFRRQAEVPPPLKWAAGIVAALLVAGIGGSFTWLVTTVNEMQVTLARMDERMEGGEAASTARIADMERRMGRLEAIHERERP